MTPPQPQDKPKICPLMSRPVLGNGNIIQLHRVECLRDGCMYWKPGWRSASSFEQTPSGKVVEIKNEIPGKCRFRGA